MDHETLGITNVCEVREQLQRFNEAAARLQTALDAEREDSAGAAREVLLRETMVAARFNARIVDPRDARVPLEKLRHGESVLGVCLHPQLQGLQPLQKQE